MLPVVVEVVLEVEVEVRLEVEVEADDGEEERRAWRSRFDSNQISPFILVLGRVARSSGSDASQRGKSLDASVPKRKTA